MNDLTERELLRLLEHVDEGVVVADEERRIRHVNRRAREMLGADGKGWQWLHRIYQADGRTHVELDDLPLARALRGESVDGIEVVVRRGDGSHRHALVRACPLDGLGAVAFFRDVTEQKRRHDSALRRATTTDPVTRLPNRDGVVRVLTELLGAGRTPVCMALDLDGFKAVNDTHGHAAGDAVLMVVAERLRRRVRPSDVVGRAYRGDEFLVVLPSVASDAEAVEVAARLLEDVRAPIVLPSRAMAQVTASIGVALADLGELAEDLIERADRAERAAKSGGKDRFVFAR